MRGNGSRCVPALGRQTGAAQDTPPAAHCCNVHGPGKFSHAALLPVPCSGHAPHSALLNAALYVLPTPSLSAGSCILFRRHAAASPVRCPAQQSLERTSHHDAPPTAALEWHTRERRVQGRGGDTGEGEAQDYELKAKPRGWRQAGRRAQPAETRRQDGEVGSGGEKGCTSPAEGRSQGDGEASRLCFGSLPSRQLDSFFSISC